MSSRLAKQWTRPLRLVVVACIVAGCSTSAAEIETEPDAEVGLSAGTEAAPEVADEASVTERPDWASHFAVEGVVGTFALRHVGTVEIEVYDLARAETRFAPASTFKILNSLIILQTGAIPDVDTELPWDGTDRGIPLWNRDQSLRSAIEVSAVWFYQELAREVGEEDMRTWVSAADYGNADIDGEIDRFWLDGDLRISALEQIDFLTRLVEGDLPFDDDVVQAVREILVRESGDGWAWSHKTGTIMSVIPNRGWLVGIAERADDTWVFALNIDLEPVESAATEIDPQARQRLARAILEAEGALPPR